MLKNLILMILLLLCFDASAEFSLIVPAATKHIQHNNEPYDYNDDNYGLGLLYIIGKNEVGAVYINEDSNNNENIYFYYARNYIISNDMIASISLMLPTGYEAVTVAPVLSFQYKFVRVSTTYPVGKIIDAPADVVNVQLVIPIKF